MNSFFERMMQSNEREERLLLSKTQAASLLHQIEGRTILNREEPLDIHKPVPTNSKYHGFDCKSLEDKLNEYTTGVSAVIEDPIVVESATTNKKKSKKM